MECKHKCDLVIREGKRKEIGSLINQIMTVPHCYPSVVHNTSEITVHVSVGVWVIVHIVVDSKGTGLIMRSGAEVNMTTRTEMTMIIARSATMVGMGTIVKTMRGMSGSVALIDIREVMSAG